MAGDAAQEVEEKGTVHNRHDDGKNSSKENRKACRAAPSPARLLANLRSFSATAFNEGFLGRELQCHVFAPLACLSNSRSALT